MHGHTRKHPSEPWRMGGRDAHPGWVQALGTLRARGSIVWKTSPGHACQLISGMYGRLRWGSWGFVFLRQVAGHMWLLMDARFLCCRAWFEPIEAKGWSTHSKCLRLASVHTAWQAMVLGRACRDISRVLQLWCQLWLLARLAGRGLPCNDHNSLHHA